MRGFALCFDWFFDREFNDYPRFRSVNKPLNLRLPSQGSTPHPPTPSPRSGERGRKRAGITQIHWDFESGVLRNVGKDGAIRPSAIHLFHAKTHTDVLRTLLRAYVPGSATSWATPSATASPVAAALRDLRGLRYWLRLA